MYLIGASLHLVEYVLGIIELLGLNLYSLLLYLLKDCQQILFNLFADSLLKLLLNFLAVFKPF